MPRRNRRYAASSLTPRCPPAWNQKTREEVLGTPTTQGDFAALVTEFAAIQENPRRVLPNVYAGLDSDTNDGYVDYADRDHWLTQLASSVASGRTFGVAAPTVLSEADPLGLRFQTDGVTLRGDVLFLDCDATSDDTAAQLGPVVVVSPNAAKLPDGTTAKTSNAGNFFAGGTGAGYYYQFLGGPLAWSSLDEFGGGGGRTRFLDNASAANKTITVYVRYSDANIIRSSLHFGRRSGQTDAGRIIIRGYPTDAMPVIRCGTAVTGGTDVTELPSLRMGQTAGQGRVRMNFRWLWFVGNRPCEAGEFDADPAELIFAQPILFIGSASSDISFRNCVFTGFQPIKSDNAQAGSFPQYVDIAYDARDNLATYHFGAITTEGSIVEVSHCYFKGADIDIPFYEYGDVFSETNKLLARAIDGNGASNVTVAYSTFEGFCSNDYVHFAPRTVSTAIAGIWVHHNVITSNGYKCVLMQAATGETATGLFEKNFIYNYGTNGVQSIGWSGFDCNGQNVIVRNNVIANGVDGQTPTDANTINGMKFATRNDQTPLTDGRVYGNIFWNAGMIFGTTSAWVNLTTPVTGNEIYNNIFHGVDLGEKDSAIEDAPIQVNFTTGGIGTNNRIYSNNITRDPGDTNASTSMVVRTGAGTYTQYPINGVVTGYENNTALDPQFADPANGNFTVGNAALRAMLPSDMPYTRELTGAWRPPGV